MTTLKQGVFSSLPFNVVVEKIIRIMHRPNYGIDIGTNGIRVIGFTDDVMIVTPLFSIRLIVNDNVNKVIELFANNNRVDNVKIRECTVGKVHQFVYIYYNR